MLPTLSLLFYGLVAYGIDVTTYVQTNQEAKVTACMASMDPGYKKKSPKRIKESGSRTHIFESFVTIIGVKSTINSLCIH